jgi:hypothetical protein
MEGLVARLHEPEPPKRDRTQAKVCGGTLRSREQYLVDLERGYRDARLRPIGALSVEQIAAWTAAIHDGEP